MAFPPIVRRRALLTGAALSALLLPGIAGVLPVAAQDGGGGPTTAQAAPEDTVAFISFDLDPDSAQWTQAQELLGRMGLPNALDELRTGILEDPGNSGADEVTAADLDALLGGEAGFVVLPQAIENLRTFGEAAIEVAESGALATPVAVDDDEAVADAFEEAFAEPLANLGDEGFGVAAILEPSDIDAAWTYVEDQVRTAVEDGGGEVEEVDYNGTTILLGPEGELSPDDMAVDALPLPDADAVPDGSPVAGLDEEAAEDEDAAETTEDELDAMGGAGMDLEAPSGQLATARVGDFILVAASAADLEPMIDAATGDAPTLADSEDMETVRAEFDTDEELLFAYFSGPELWASLGDELASYLDELSAGMYAGMEDIEAYRDAHSAIAIWADEPGLRVDSVTLRVDGEPLPELVPDAVAIEFAGQVPADTILYNAGTVARQQLDAAAFSIAQLINQGMSGEMMTEPQTLDDVLVMFTPEYAEEQLAGAESILGFNLQSDFTDLLTGEFGLAIGGPQLSGSAFGIDAILSLPATDAAALADTTQELARLAEGAAGGALSARREGEDTVYVLQDPSAGGVPAFEFGVIGDELLAGTETGLESYAQGPAEALADDEQFQSVMALLPDDGYQVGYVNLGSIIELVLAFSGMGAPGANQDADLSCAEYADEAEAQAALEEDSLEHAALDSDFDGQACEDFFGVAGTPVAGGGPENVRALGLVAWERDGKQGSNSLLYVADDGS